MRAIQKIGLCDWLFRFVTRHAVIVERPILQAWNVVVTACRLQGGDWCANKALCFYSSSLLGRIRIISHSVIKEVPHRFRQRSTMTGVPSLWRHEAARGGVG